VKVELKLRGMALPSAACLALCALLLLVALPRGFVLLGAPLGLPVGLALCAGAVALGTLGAALARERAVLWGSLGAALLLAPAYDPGAPLARWPVYVAAAALFVLHVEFAALHARVERLARLPRAHVTQVGRATEVELAATARRIAQGWPVPLASGGLLLAAMLGLELGLASVAPRALGQSVELHGPVGLGLAGAVVLAALGALAWRRRAQGAGGPAGGSPP
jgi:hypothetical protein